MTVPNPCHISLNKISFLGQHRTIPALRLKHRSGSCGTASALPKCSIMSGCGTRIVLRGQKPLALCDRCPCFGSLFPPLAALTFAASSIICAFGLASAAPRSPYRHLELCGIALGPSGTSRTPSPTYIFMIHHKFILLHSHAPAGSGDPALPNLCSPLSGGQRAGRPTHHLSPPQFLINSYRLPPNSQLLPSPHRNFTTPPPFRRG